MHGAIYFTGAVPQVDKRRNEGPPTEAALFADCKIDQRRSARSRPWSRQDYEAQMLTNEEFASLLRVRNAADALRPRFPPHTWLMPGLAVLTPNKF